jgi:hypothetical protein
VQHSIRRWHRRSHPLLYSPGVPRQGASRGSVREEPQAGGNPSCNGRTPGYGPNRQIARQRRRRAETVWVEFEAPVAPPGAVDLAVGV